MIPRESEFDRYNEGLLQNALSVLCGERLGYGITRTTFAMRFCDDKVVKVEDVSSALFQNVLEWRAWDYIKEDPQLSKYFIPCVEISQCGCVLVQMRAEPVPEDLEEVELPDFVGDYKRENLGVFEGRIVVLDYGLWNPVARKGNVRIRKRKTY